MVLVVVLVVLVDHRLLGADLVVRQLRQGVDLVVLPRLALAQLVVAQLEVVHLALLQLRVVPPPRPAVHPTRQASARPPVSRPVQPRV